MRTVAIVQARMTSTRLPGKVLAELAGAPVIARVIERLHRSRRIDDAVIACTDQPADDPLVAWASGAGVAVYRGPEDDVLTRFVGAARQARADAIVRVTADCPLIDPAVVDRVAAELLDHSTDCDYASNVERRRFPRGLDAEAFFFDTLLKADRLGTSAAEREHVTVGIRLTHRELFRTRHVVAGRDDSHLRWTIDTAADLEFIRALFDGLGLANRIAEYDEIVTWCRAHPELCRLDDAHHTWDPARERAGGING